MWLTKGMLLGPILNALSGPFAPQVIFKRHAPLHTSVIVVGLLAIWLTVYLTRIYMREAAARRANSPTKPG